MVSVLAHRIKLKPSIAYLKQPTTFLREEFATFCDRNGIVMDTDDTDVP